MPADFLMLKGNHIKIIIIEHQSVRLSFSIINPGGFIPKSKSFKIIIPNHRIIYHIRYVGHFSFERAHHNAARHSSPIGSFSDFTCVSPVFVSYSPGMPCRTAPPTLSPVPFLSCLRLIETAPNDGHTIISEGLIIILSKMRVSFR